MTPKNTTSLPPEGNPIEVAKSGIKIQIRWKLIGSILGLVLGGSSLAGLAAMFNVKDSVAEDFSGFKTDQIIAHQHIDDTLTKQTKKAEIQDVRIDGISKIVTSVQTTQQRDVARTEARRLTEKISDRKEREDTYDRLYELNLRRLQRGEDPCRNVGCD